MGYSQTSGDEVLGKVRRTIDRWFVWVSVTGLIYVEPRRRTLSLTDLADMIDRLSIVCDHGFQGLIAFEFSRCSLDARRWSRVEDLLHKFARQISATMLPHRDRRKAAAWIMLYRCAPRSSSGAPGRAFPVQPVRPPT